MFSEKAKNCKHLFCFEAKSIIEEFNIIKHASGISVGEVFSRLLPLNDRNTFVESPGASQLSAAPEVNLRNKRF